MLTNELRRFLSHHKNRRKNSPVRTEVQHVELLVSTRAEIGEIRDKPEDFGHKLALGTGVACTHRCGNMANLFKAYSGSEDKNSGLTTDKFESKFMLFLERCDLADIPEEDRHRAFSIILMGNARQFYSDSLKPQKLSLKSLELVVKSRFQTPERVRTL